MNYYINQVLVSNIFTRHICAYFHHISYKNGYWSAVISKDKYKTNV